MVSPKIRLMTDCSQFVCNLLASEVLYSTPNDINCTSLVALANKRQTVIHSLKKKAGSKWLKDWKGCQKNIPESFDVINFNLKDKVDHLPFCKWKAFF